MDTIVRKLAAVTDSQKKGYNYTVLSSNGEYEKRVYPPSTWICTSVTGVYQDTAKIEAFRKLQSYVMGQNEAGAQLAMQAPILTRVSPHEGLSFEREFVVSAFLCRDQAGREPPPAPTNPEVHIERLPEITVFVRSFEGMACEEKWAFETRQLLHHLSNRENIRTDTYFTATYHSPFQLVSSRNEVWMLEYNTQKDLTLYTEKKPHAQQFVQMGDRRLNLPSFLTWPLYFLLGYIYVLTGVLSSALSAVWKIKQNRYGVADCWDATLAYGMTWLSWKSVSTLAVTSVSTMWKVALGMLKTSQQ